MSRILLVLFAAWLLLAGGLTQVKTWLSAPQVAQVGATIQRGASVVLTPVATPRAVDTSTVSVRAPVNTQPVVVVPLPRPTTIVVLPTALPTVAPAIPLDKGEYLFIDRGSSVVDRYCVQVSALGKEVCDPDISMTYPETQMFIARSLKLGTMAGTVIP